MNVHLFVYVVVFILASSYCYIHGLVLTGLKKLLHYRSEPRRGISVVVAARNEEKNISRCLQSLVAQQYPEELFEIIIVNDRSTDKTAAIVHHYQDLYPSVKLVTIENIASDLPPKKNALAEGIRRSKFGILAFTDADCFVPPRWLSSLAEGYEEHVGAIAGYSPIAARTDSAPHKWIQFFLEYVEIKNSIGAAAAIGLGKAYMCTGRNFSYRKEVFNEVGGFEEIKHSISGDDDLFLQLIQRKTRWVIRYMLSPESFVETLPPYSLRSFFNQRKRHFSAAKYYPVRMKIIFGTIHAFNALCLVLLFMVPPIGVLVLLFKFIVDGIVLYSGTRYFGNRRLIRGIPVLEFASIIYNLVVGPLGLIGKFEWKENAS